MTEFNSREREHLPPIDSSEPLVDSLPDPASEQDLAVEATGNSVETDAGIPVAVPEDRPRCWYCGIAEAIAWWMGTLIVHVMAGAFFAIVLVVVRVIRANPRPADIGDPQSMFLITGGEMFAFVLAAMLSVAVRYWGRMFDELNLSRPDMRHVWLVVGGTLPLAICVSAWGVPVQLVWNIVRDAIPVLKLIDNLNTMEVIQNMANDAFLPALIFVVAVLPAIGEELIFRGAIGRALISNIGLWSGVIATTIMFGCMHLHPVHAVAVMPLGLAIHLVYLWSRSFWLPMLLHFLNNSWAMIASNSEAADPLRHGTEMHWIQGMVLVTAIVTVTSIVIAFWQTRVRLFDEDGNEFRDPRFPVRVCRRPGIHRRPASAAAGWWWLATVGMIICHLMVAADLIGA